MVFRFEKYFYSNFPTVVIYTIKKWRSTTCNIVWKTQEGEGGKGGVNVLMTTLKFLNKTNRAKVVLFKFKFMEMFQQHKEHHNK